MPELPVDFYFTQMRLQDYLDCKRRFQLRYLLKQPWPAQVVEPAELFGLHLEQGQRFHRLVQRYVMGMPADNLHRMASEPPLSKWWQDFLTYGLEELPEVRVSEVTMTSSFGGYPLIGKFDLLAVSESGNVFIVDWKTSKHIPSSSQLRARMQSRLYPFIIAREGVRQTGLEAVEPDRILMRYWYAEAPQTPIEIAYSQAQYEEDGEFIKGLIHEIETRDTEQFALTDDVKRCRYCVYRSLCDRGVHPGPMKEFGEDFEDNTEWPSVIDMDQLPEIEF
jgi:hypothetical protein